MSCPAQTEKNARDWLKITRPLFHGSWLAGLARRKSKFMPNTFINVCFCKTEKIQAIINRNIWTTAHRWFHRKGQGGREQATSHTAAGYAWHFTCDISRQAEVARICLFPNHQICFWTGRWKQCARAGADALAGRRPAVVGKLTPSAAIILWQSLTRRAGSSHK